MSRRLTSHTPEFSTRLALIKHLIDRLASENLLESWAHWELVDRRGYFFNVLFGRAPWLEVAFEGEAFQLNCDRREFDRSKAPEMPEHWQSIGKLLWRVPAEDSQLLIQWVDGYFNSLPLSSSHRALTGWIAE